MTGVVGSFSSTIGVEHSGHIIASLAHAWFNLALVIRLWNQRYRHSPRYEDAFRCFHRPWPSEPLDKILVADAPNVDSVRICIHVHFLFTSFALVRWLAPNTWTLEALMAVEEELQEFQGIVSMSACLSLVERRFSLSFWRPCACWTVQQNNPTKLNSFREFLEEIHW